MPLYRPSPNRRTPQLPRCALLLLLLAAPLLLIFASQTQPAHAGSCAEDPSNLLLNGTMAGGPPGPYGVVAQNWNAFVKSENVPNFENALNEGWDPNGSQYIWSDYGPWNAGIYQTVTNLTPGQTFHFWMVWGQSLHDVSGDNQRTTGINRQIGIDLTGGTDPTAPTVQWTVPYTGTSGFNRIEWNLYFIPSSAKATFFLRAINSLTDGRNKVFFDTACLFPASGSPTTTPWLKPTATPTATATLPPGYSVRYDDADPAIQYSGAWSSGLDSRAIGGDYHYARGAPGAPVSAALNFSGVQVTFWYIAYKNRGLADVYLDGALVDTIDEYEPVVDFNLSRSYGGLADGAHTLVVQNAGAKNPLATDSIIVVDAFDVFVPSGGNTPTPTNTPTSTATSTPTSTRTATATPTATATTGGTPTSTETPTNTPTSTTTNTPTSTRTATATATPFVPSFFNYLPFISW